MAQGDYQKIAQAIEFLRESAIDQPSLDKAAQHVGLSPYHFQRLFKRFAGVSPKRFLQHLTSSYARELLRDSTPVLETSYSVGLSSPGRLHDLMVNVEAATPGEIKSGGDGMQILYGIHPTPFGDCILAQTERGICRLEFVDADNPKPALERLRHDWPLAELKECPEKTETTVEQIFPPLQSVIGRPLPLLLRGTNFQLQVWQALLRIPSGSLTTYGNLAQQLGQPNASRAVGTAVGRNPIGYLIPCHRVLRGDGGIGGYHWGKTRKLAILGCELAKND
ncbi:AraC family transcriptional regulator, regulatory protein of adaptative response / methylated-DNA-[protein]-cysteine methyltransferase [Malonomonas rubra DSM 5091]|uniref:methylated-DNA--[protein]-cysteine S-methyltransferase n=1 Tax=Malonomonas rubra DSM 5091 TaxID=1122189 RepID=A0A1M6LNM7_MALRU|nr:methylated-DNA--[protein]-cysteine S-methyltransferase [Malonomonas rubra]SHJ72827.1 AraC family transcriptional regulator, regulatory protein of adaptative response / methylated-DNA-[protein]-cysteine methyltransferase [Malonomonas rubra DSM 5091]